MEAKRKPPFEQFVAFRRFGGVLEFTPDGEQVYFVSDISGQFNIWRVFVEGGWPSQLTGFVDRTVRSVAVSPADGTIAFCADEDGDEFHQVFLLDPNGGWPEQITDAPQVQHFVTPASFSPDGAKLAYAANARTPTDMEVWVRDLATGETRPVFGEGCGTLTAAGAWSPDGSKLLAVELVSPTESSLHLVDLSTQRVEQVTASGEEAVNLPGPWKSDGSGFYLLSDEGREFKGIAFYRLADGSREWIETPEHDVEALASSADGRLLCWLVNEDGYERLDGRETESDTALVPCGLPAGARPFGAGSYPPIAVSADGSRLAVVLSSPRRPPEVHVVERATGGSSQLTENWIGGGLAEEQLVDAELISYRSFDGREIPAWLYRPLDLDGRTPVVLSIHGGPQAQERPIYNPLHQYLVSRGMAVLATNIRGSTGYGKTYQRLINRDWGGGDLRDWEHAVHWLHQQDWVDPERIGVFGGSYGGFAVLSCVTRLPDYWAAAVDVFGPSNLITLTRATPPTWRRAVKRMIGDPDEDAELLRERSPMTYIENAKAPLLVIQGAKDPRVVRSESDQLVDKLHSLGRTVEYVVFDDEGHGFTRQENQQRALRLAADWLQQHLVQ